MRVVDILKLKESIDILFGHLIDSGINSLSLDTQYYWEVEERLQYDIINEPKGYVVGDFFQDLDVLEGVLKEGENVVAYSLTELAPLIAYVGRTASRKLAPQGG